MLLTSSQVSIALSSGIVILFTTALFLSGYAIQQRTLRDLRAAIKPSPRPEPKIFLPDRFKKSTTELPDGTVIEVDDGNYRGSSSSSSSQKPLNGGTKKTQQQQRGDDTGRDGFVVEIKSTTQEEINGRTAAKSKDQRATKDRDGKKKSNQQDEKRQKKATDQAKQKDGNDSVKKSRPPGPDAVPHPDDEDILVSRAERRRLIKQELQKLSEGTERGYWQRRLW